MHILINGSFWTRPNVGSGQYLHGLLRWLPQLAPRHRYTLLLPTSAAATGPPVPDGVQTIRVRTPFDPSADRAGNGGDQRDGWRRNLAKLWFEQVGVPHLVRLLRPHRRPYEPTILHTPYLGSPLHTIVPLVTTIPDLIPILLPEYRGGLHVRAYMHLVSQAARRAQHIITFSQHSRRDIADHLHIPLERITATLLAAAERYTLAAAPGEDLAAATASVAAAVAARYGLPQPFIYYVGGLDARKNVAVLLRAVALLRERGQAGATLAIAGDALGHDRRLFPDLDGLIAHLGLHDVVRRIRVPYEDGPLLYQACTLFAFPSRYEGFGLPPLEAMACGAPVLSSNASSLPEVVGEAAIQVAPDDVAGWAAALARLLNNADLRATLCERGLLQSRRFSWRRVAEETLQVYEQTAG